VLAASIIRVMSNHATRIGTSRTRQNLVWTNGEESEDQVRARKPMGEGQTTASLARRGGGSTGKLRQARERNGNGPYQGPLGTNREITKHKKMRIRRRRKIGGAV
jgi:hypothetical protein